MPGDLQPLALNFQIVDQNGFPTPYFIKWAQQRQIDIKAGITAAQAQALIDDWAAARTLTAGNGLSGGGTLAADRTFNVNTGTGLTIALDAVRLADTAVTPGTYGDSTHVAQITVDQQGRITAVANVSVSGGGGGITPAVRSSNIQSSSNSSYTITWPAGAIAGDPVFIFGGHGFGINIPSGWTQFDKQDGANFNGAVFGKILTASDITTGSVTVTTAGGFNGVFAAVAINSTTPGMTGLRTPFVFIRNSGSAVTSIPLTTQSPQSTDTTIAFFAQRGAVNCTFSSGFTSLQAINAASASGAVGRFTGTLGPFGVNETGNFSGAASSGYYSAVITLR